ncbi:uncharacterized protein DUF4304 [Streptomyces sp. TLI_235]|nr:DUF4304 domain-containing protein [Streptomyces sp. TLI_235]PBC78071.1 uncharacterized protein DUF4304 [Streptomyces sp. TLI_235]
MTAQALYRAMLREGVAARLRALGWKGSGLRFELPDPNAWVQLGFQSSRFNSAESLDFTVNISVIDRRAWEAYQADRPELPARPNPVVYYDRRFEPVRIGYLLADRRDTWWHITTGQPGDAVDRTADGVVAAVADQAMPEIRRRIAAI